MAITGCGMALAAWGIARRTATPPAPPEAWLLTRAARPRCQTVAARSRISNRMGGREHPGAVQDEVPGHAGHRGEAEGGRFDGGRLRHDAGSDGRDAQPRQHGKRFEPGPGPDA